MRSYKDDLRIDENNLEVEWMKQPRLYMYWAEQETAAQVERDKLQRRLTVLHAEYDAKIRAAPKTFGIEKISEPAIKNTIQKIEEYRELELSLIEANKNLKLLSAAVTAFEHKKRSLTKLTDLWIAGYYGGSKPSYGDKIEKEAVEGQKRLQQRKERRG